MLCTVAELKPVYLLTGGDRPKITRALDRLRGRFDPNAVEFHPAPETPPGDVVAACNAIGLFGGADGDRLVVVEDVDGRPGNDGRLVGGWKAADVKEIAAYVAAPAPGTVLALVAHELKADSPLGKACAKTGDVLVYEIGKRELAKWVVEQFKLRGAKVKLDTARRLIEVVGDNPDELSTEVDKLATWAAGDPIDTSAVELLAAPVAETASFELTDAWGKRDPAATLSAAESIMERSGDAPRDVVPRLAWGLISHVTRLRQCQVWQAEGITASEAATRMKRHRFYVEKLWGQASRFTEDELRDAIVRFAALDLALKGRSRLAPELELERALIETTRAA
jgi:DNA polymerase III delta subunit